MKKQLTPQILLQAYSAGIFPMAEGRDETTVHWVDPSRRGIITLENFHISRSLRKEILREQFTPKFDSDFSGVVQACADRDETWINDTIAELYMALHQAGHAHSQELWQGEELIGGVYGVALGGAFFGESMFSRRPSASKIAMAWLVDRLCQAGFTLFDTQFLTPHLKSLGGIEISRAAYLARLAEATTLERGINALQLPQSAQGVIQRNGQTS